MARLGGVVSGVPVASKSNLAPVRQGKDQCGGNCDEASNVLCSDCEAQIYDLIVHDWPPYLFILGESFLLSPSTLTPYCERCAIAKTTDISLTVAIYWGRQGRFWSEKNGFRNGALGPKWAWGSANVTAKEESKIRSVPRYAHALGSEEHL